MRENKEEASKRAPIVKALYYFTIDVIKFQNKRKERIPNISTISTGFQQFSLKMRRIRLKRKTAGSSLVWRFNSSFHSSI